MLGTAISHYVTREAAVRHIVIDAASLCGQPIDGTRHVAADTWLLGELCPDCRAELSALIRWSNERGMEP